ncbi:30S ribosomal protein S4 [Saprospira sp. CCB-QB6]|uniref:30S ribosomal protein S4 n=1 Tax=Saprospira sp. CCB-QB6 TaxID=3023936 RepID=UPI00234BC1DC|nr:30S ribosomal protein S4 [Saprospira sp. CCB-QB6]WCL82798.1 30S ribosomal protein S4 [Saprospira sp. CCB-QB6]
MARYRGPKTKKSRAFGESIYGYDKYFERKKYPPGQHGLAKRRKQKSDYGKQLMEKQKVKYAYGVLERQFRRMFEAASRKSGVTGEILLQMLEARLDNVVYRLGIAPTRRAARQLVTHGHIAVNGVVTNVPSYSVRPGEVVAVRGKSQGLVAIQESVAANSKEAQKYSWLEFNAEKLEGSFVAYPNRDEIPEPINEQLIVELYSK